MAGTTIKGVGNGSNVQMPGSGRQQQSRMREPASRQYGIRPRAVPRQQTRARIDA